MFLLSLLLTVSAHMDMSSDSDGIPYGDICMGILGTNYLFSGPDCTDSYRKAPCYCNDTRFIESVVYCINEYSEHSDNFTETRHDAYHSVLHMCPTLNGTILKSFEQNLTNLEPYYGKDSGEHPGFWPVSGAFALTSTEMSNAVKAYEVPLNRMKKNTRYGSALVAYWGAVLLIKGIIFWGTKVFPTMPMIWGNSKPGRLYRKYLGIFGCRQQMILVAMFCILTILLTFCDVPYFSPDYSFRYSNSAVYGHLIGSRTGIFCVYIMPLFFLFAGRNNFLQYLTGWTQEPFLVFHRYIARVEVVLLLVHAIAFSIQRAGVQWYGHMWTQAYWNWGVAGMALAAFSFVQGIKFIRRANYELFIALHIIAAVVFIFAGYYHLKLLEEPEDLNFYYATIAVWGFDHMARLLRVLYNRPCTCTISLADNDKNMLVVTVDKPAWWPMSIAPGTYVFVHFLNSWTRALQSHPLTLTASCSDPTKIKLYFRVYKGISKMLANEVLSRENGEIETKVLLDGPYGTSYDMVEYDEVVFVAGGSGITAPFAYIQNSVLKFPYRKFQKTTLHWAVNNIAALEWFSHELKFLSEEADVNVHIYLPDGSQVSSLEKSDSTDGSELKSQLLVGETDGNSSNSGSSIEHHGRLNVSKIVEFSIKNATGPTGIMCCGPPKIHNDVRNAVAQNLHKTSHFIDYLEETYTW